MLGKMENEDGQSETNLGDDGKQLAGMMGVTNRNEAMAKPKIFQKFHHFTVCMVPPESAVEVWTQVTELRTLLRDPGLYRWPPHANLLYPFVDVYEKTETGEKVIKHQVLEGLERSCRKCEPFLVRLEQFGTFGGAKRGVLWLLPDSSALRHHEIRRENGETESRETAKEPLRALQTLLEEQFPMCTEQRTTGGTFNPHMTLSHFVNLDQAVSAQEEAQRVFERPLDFLVDRIYLLHRKGDDGQFLRVAEILLGESHETGVIVHEPPKKFCHMPETEADWVYQERQALKARRNRKASGNGGRRNYRSAQRTRPRTKDSPEVIAAKRAERKAKREMAEAAAAPAGES